MVDAVTASAAASKAQTSRATLTDNFETFLTLLTEQMKNQDPLSPMDSTEFVNQLVQFSAVEQQINQNQNLETLIGLQVSMGQATAASYLGREVAVNTPQSELKDGSAAWSYTLPRQAESAKILVQNSAGKIVFQTEAETSAGKHGFVWDGKDNSGAVLPDGVYSLSVAALDAAVKEIPATVEMTGRVSAVDMAGEEPALLIGAVRAPLSGVTTLREAEQTPAA